MAWRHPRVTVDGLVVIQGKLVAIRRGNEPFRGMPALPGGFLELGERTVDAVVREVQEETGLETKVVRLVGVFSTPTRDPRGHTVSIAYALEAVGGSLAAGSDAADIVLIDPDRPPAMAFDHNEIVRRWRES
jgi:8-oxo-dGTP diphosphatase